MRFYPAFKQVQHLEKEYGHGRYIWNHALAKQSTYTNRKEDYDIAIMSGCLPDEMALLTKPLSWNLNRASKKVTQLKNTEETSWLKEVNSSSLTQKLMDLDKAFQGFFTLGKGYPKFKKKSHEQSIRLQLDQRHIAKNYIAGKKLKVPLLGELNLVWSHIPKGIPKQVTIKKDCSGRYFVCFMCEELILPLKKTGKSIGLDVGIKAAVMDSEGTCYGVSQFLKAALRSLKREQRILSRRTKGSSRWKKQRLVVARIHARVVQCRRDLLHKISTYLIQNFDTIYIEDLNLKGLLKNHKIARALADVGIHEFFRQLKYKALWFGKEVIEIDRFFPSSKKCSKCGKIHKDLKLSDRKMKCDCGCDLDRDHNAAINIEQAGIACRGAVHPLSA